MSRSRRNSRKGRSRRRTSRKSSSRCFRGTQEVVHELRFKKQTLWPGDGVKRVRTKILRPIKVDPTHIAGIKYKNVNVNGMLETYDSIQYFARDDTLYCTRYTGIQNPIVHIIEGTTSKLYNPSALPVRV